MATKLDFTLFDTALFGAAANTEHVLFQVAQGGDSTHTKTFTNSRGAGTLPNEESFEVRKIVVFPDDNFSAADRENFLLQSYVEIRVSDELVFNSPLRLCVGNSAFGGIYTQAAAADEALIGLKGDGYELVNPIIIPGGTSFRAILFQGTATAANMDVKLVLMGILNRP